MAEAARTQMAARTGQNAIAAAKAAFALRGFALKAAKAAAPYVHARLRPTEPKRPGEKSHEEWLADMERAAAEVAQHEAVVEAGASGAAAEANDRPHAQAARPIVAAPLEPPPGAGSVDARAGPGASDARANAPPARSPPRRFPRERPAKRSWMTY